eukprot:tig00000882_g5257.t1
MKPSIPRVYSDHQRMESAAAGTPGPKGALNGGAPGPSGSEKTSPSVSRIPSFSWNDNAYSFSMGAGAPTLASLSLAPPPPPGLGSRQGSMVNIQLANGMRRTMSMRSLDSRQCEEEFLNVESDRALADFQDEWGSNAGYEETGEFQRLAENSEGNSIWHRWGPYLSERQWGTVREDYSAEGDAWNFVTHDMSRSKAYRWGEDGLGGICDRHALICFSLALWNGKDPILKERLFGLTNPEGNHGEDVKEYYWYLDSTPTHSYMKFLYKYPQAEFPYERLAAENKKRSFRDPEFELLDTGLFNENRYWDVVVEYAKADPEDILIQITATNRGPQAARLTLLPQTWFRNTWAYEKEKGRPRAHRAADHCVALEGVERYGARWLYYEGGDEYVFTENETNNQRLYKSRNHHGHVKDGFHEYIVRGNKGAVDHNQGTKVAKVFRLDAGPGESKTVRLRLNPYKDLSPERAFGAAFDEVFNTRRQEADDFYAAVTPGLPEDDARIQRQAFAGMMWSKQFFYYSVRDWLLGDPGMPKPPASRLKGRNMNWQHFHASEVLSMPDKWEYPWFAAWDSAFHTVPIALIDPHFAKDQLVTLVREWYMHPNGQLAAYEWNFEDVNPPVHAWATYRVYKIEQKRTGRADRRFLASVFHKLLLNFTWWANRKDAENTNVFEGGFLGLDNIGVFDRNMQLPNGMRLEQSDATSWMAMYCLNMLSIALELALHDPAYEDAASKFFEHFMYISEAMNKTDANGRPRLWDEADGFYYDSIRHEHGHSQHLKVRSLVGLMPMLAVTTIEPDVLEKFPKFRRRMEWFITRRKDLVGNIDFTYAQGRGQRVLLSLVPKARLVRLLRRMLDENEFLSAYGIRSLSKFHAHKPFEVTVGESTFKIAYEPAESQSSMFGGNSNWRGPIWYPLNYLLVESLQKFDFYYCDTLRVECPVGSGKMVNLWEASLEVQRRLAAMFRLDTNNRRPVFGSAHKFQSDPLWRDNILFYEYFHADNGAGLGASHQTGWTGLICKIIDQLHMAQATHNMHQALAQVSLNGQPVPGPAAR